MTTQEIKMSALSAEITLSETGLTRERVMALTGRRPRPVRIIVDVTPPNSRCRQTLDNPDVPAVPLTLEERHKAAVKAVEMLRSGEVQTARQALIKVGLSEGYCSAVCECLKGSGPMIDAALAEVTIKRNHGLCFVRWYLNKPPLNGAECVDNNRMVAAVRNSPLKSALIAERAGVSISLIQRLRSGETTRAKKTTRDAIFAALN
jgi:hypothetical protein